MTGAGTPTGVGAADTRTRRKVILSLILSIYFFTSQIINGEGTGLGRDLGGLDPDPPLASARGCKGEEATVPLEAGAIRASLEEPTSPRKVEVARREIRRTQVLQIFGPPPRMKRLCPKSSSSPKLSCPLLLLACQSPEYPLSMH